MDKYYKILNEIYEHLVLQKVQEKGQQIMPNNYVAVLIE